MILWFKDNTGEKDELSGKSSGTALLENYKYEAGSQLCHCSQPANLCATTCPAAWGDGGEKERDTDK